MFRKISDFIDVFNEEKTSTIKIFRCISNDFKSEKINPNIRSLERLAWHITQTCYEMPYTAGLLTENKLSETPIPASVEEIIKSYEAGCNEVVKAVSSNWKDSDLEDELPMYGEMWKKGQILFILITHQTHHRSQMTILLRSLELPVVGTYGPSKEEWVSYGMPAME